MIYDNLFFDKANFHCKVRYKFPYGSKVFRYKLPKYCTDFVRTIFYQFLTNSTFEANVNLFLFKAMKNLRLSKKKFWAQCAVMEFTIY